MSERDTNAKSSTRQVRPDWPIIESYDDPRNNGNFPCVMCHRQPPEHNSWSPWNSRGGGRMREYCSSACRQQAYRERKKDALRNQKRNVPETDLAALLAEIKASRIAADLEGIWPL